MTGAGSQAGPAASAAPASVVIVSRDRPSELVQAVRGTLQLDHPAFEVVVVADGPGLAALAAAGLDPGLKTARCDDANISAARNAGIELAAGEVVAFLDDDAVPEPTWLARLAAPLADPAVGAAGGFVRGRNGIAFQWRARRARPDGTAEPIADWGDAPRLFPPGPGGVTKVEGTNMAFRRAVLAEAGGFDPAFRFYLDETDLCFRLAARGLATALVPLAQVHHGYAASPRRRPDRVPRDLTEIGASLAAFLRRHLPEAGHAAALAAQEAAERARLARHLVSGAIEPRDLRALMATFAAGVAAGRDRAPAPLPPLAPPLLPFRPLQPRPGPDLMLSGRPAEAARLRALAAERVAAGARVTLLLFSASARPHRMRFTPGGWWEQAGGLWGRSERTGPRVRPWRFEARVAAEAARLEPVRGMLPI